jgi:hypothetical protein
MIMKRILQSMAGGVLVMMILAMSLALSNSVALFLLFLWPIFIFWPLFPATESDPLFPGIPSGVGILVSLIFATLVYSILIYMVLWWRGKRKHLP